MRQHADRLNHFLFLQRHRSTGPGASARAGSGSAAVRDRNIRNRAQRRSARFPGTTRACSLRRSDQLQHFLRVVQPLFEFRAERLCRQLCRHGNFSGRRISRDKLYFVNFDGGVLVIAQRFFKLPGEVLRLRSAHRESGDQAGKVLEGNLAGKMNAGQTGRRQQLSEASFGLPCLKRGAVKQELVVGYAEQESAIAIFGQAFPQFFPRDVELAFGTLVLYSVQASVFNENVQAVDKRPRRRIADSIGLSCGGDDSSSDV